MARLCPLFSGSAGNSYYVGNRSRGVLIDAGRSAKQLEGMLRLCGMDPLAVEGVLVTHEHSDHVAGLRVFAKKFGVPVYGSQGTLEALRQSLAGLTLRPVEQGMELGGMQVWSFPLSHDSAQPTGYRLRTGDGRVFALATDTGTLLEETLEGLWGADLALVESNHDKEMLRLGGYPLPLKRRILSERGHLSNEDCAGLLPRLLGAGTRRFLLAHLSHENNTPDLAYQAALGALVQAGYVPEVDFLLKTAPPENRAGKSFLF